MVASIGIEMGGQVHVRVDQSRHRGEVREVVGDRAPEPVDSADSGPVERDPGVLADRAGAVDQTTGPDGSGCVRVDGWPRWIPLGSAPAGTGSSANMTLVERFTRVDADTPSNVE